eukprot:1187118-Prorocentrum_minimum.AAC.2
MNEAFTEVLALLKQKDEFHNQAMGEAEAIVKELQEALVVSQVRNRQVARREERTVPPSMTAFPATRGFRLVDFKARGAEEVASVPSAVWHAAFAARVHELTPSACDFPICRRRRTSRASSGPAPPGPRPYWPNSRNVSPPSRRPTGNIYCHCSTAWTTMISAIKSHEFSTHAWSRAGSQLAFAPCVVCWKVTIGVLGHFLATISLAFVYYSRSTMTATLDSLAVVSDWFALLTFEVQTERSKWGACLLRRLSSNKSQESSTETSSGDDWQEEGVKSQEEGLKSQEEGVKSQVQIAAVSAALKSVASVSEADVPVGDAPNASFFASLFPSFFNAAESKVDTTNAPTQGEASEQITVNQATSPPSDRLKSPSPVRPLRAALNSVMEVTDMPDTPGDAGPPSPPPTEAEEAITIEGDFLNELKDGERAAANQAAAEVTQGSEGEAWMLQKYLESSESTEQKYLETRDDSRGLKVEEQMASGIGEGLRVTPRPYC